MVSLPASAIEVTAAARECAAFRAAHRLAIWVGEGRRVTPRHVLRPADVSAAARALGIAAPARVRTAGDVVALHRPWRIAMTVGFLDIVDSHARPGPALVSWPDADDETVRGMWLAALPAALAATAPDVDEAEATICARVLLTKLAADPEAAPDELRRFGREAVAEEHSEAVFRFFAGWYHLTSPIPKTLDCLAELGAVQLGHAGAALTPLGRWGLDELLARAPRPISSELTVGELIARLAEVEPDEQWRAAQPWLAARDPLAAAHDLLAAAATAPADQRVAAVELVDALGPPADPAWAAAATDQTLGPHVRTRHRSVPNEPDAAWLAVEYAAAALRREGPDEAHSWLDECLPGDGIDSRLRVVERTGHPAASELAAGITAFLATGVTPTSTRTVQLKISLDRMRPPVWRRVLLPAAAPLSLLHRVIQIVMNWDDDHLHAFTVGRNRYGDPSYTPDLGDEERLRLSAAFAATDTITYRYDFGDCWDHTVRCETILDPPAGAAVPVCVTGRGDAPVEDWIGGAACVAFDLEGINRRLARYGADR
ncbi:plasmid pRiA4b ORF-3 family protein [Pseudonocardia nigra]|uniref:plasmid pRiA4b ORF-3 family protein n=1 Tax=Pseudonocardia nigra TaxID=1921578 RepID=UPI001C5E39C9|nr:plasmid pRiA4b ORF-3 family protein [Pseudonocardia nigra]